LVDANAYEMASRDLCDFEAGTGSIKIYVSGASLLATRSICWHLREQQATECISEGLQRR